MCRQTGFPWRCIEIYERTVLANRFLSLRGYRGLEIKFVYDFGIVTEIHASVFKYRNRYASDVMKMAALLLRRLIDRNY